VGETNGQDLFVAVTLDNQRQQVTDGRGLSLLLRKRSLQPESGTSAEYGPSSLRIDFTTTIEFNSASDNQEDNDGHDFDWDDAKDAVALAFQFVESWSEYLDALEDSGLGADYDSMTMEVDGEFIISEELEADDIDVEPAEAIGDEEVITPEEPQDAIIDDEPEEEEEVAITEQRDKWRTWTARMQTTEPVKTTEVVAAMVTAA